MTDPTGATPDDGATDNDAVENDDAADEVHEVHEATDNDAADDIFEGDGEAPVDVRQVLRWTAWLVGLGLLLAWVLTWVLDSPPRPLLPERDRISAAAVRISGEACGGLQIGTGFAVESELVITNAHVVAGLAEAKVVLPGGEELQGRLVAFDTVRDLAALAVSGLDTPPLRFSDPVQGASVDAAVLDDRDMLTFDRYTLGDTLTARISDIYGEEVLRQVVELGGAPERGDSGAALVDDRGEVVGVIFATPRGQTPVGYALTTTELRAFLAEAQPLPLAPTLPAPPCATFP